MNSTPKMTERESKHLATSVAKQSHGVSVKHGKTNGRPVLHLVRRQTSDIDAASVTIATPDEWKFHPWNTDNAPKPPKNEENDSNE